MIAIIDYGMGNLGSVVNMLKKVNATAIVTNNKEEIKNANKIILPGVGIFDNAIQRLKSLDIFDLLIEEALEKNKPFLGICLGMQLLTQGSEEGNLQGLGLVNANAKKFQIEDQGLRTPHMGWNTITLRKDSKLIDSSSNGDRFYFVHSYAVQCDNEGDVLTTTHYGYDFVSSFERNNVIGAQFHPEKSHKFGVKLFNNFVNIY